ncbi:bacteriohemerythrin [candidate division KSB1 bacterium]
MVEQHYIIPWDNNLEIGISWIDNQHKKLLERINVLLNALVSGKSGGEITGTVRFLEKYVETHFSTEEKYMKKYNYPEYDSHKKLHQKFCRIVEDLKIEFDVLGGTKQLAVRIEKEIWNWYKIHVAKADRDFGDFLTKRNITDNEIQLSTNIEEAGRLLDGFAVYDSPDKRKKIVHDIRELLLKIEKQL